MFWTTTSTILNHWMFSFRNGIHNIWRANLPNLYWPYVKKIVFKYLSFSSSTCYVGALLFTLEKMFQISSNSLDPFVFSPALLLIQPFLFCQMNCRRYKLLKSPWIMKLNSPPGQMVAESVRKAILLTHLRTIMALLILRYSDEKERMTKLQGWCRGQAGGGERLMSQECNIF